MKYKEDKCLIIIIKIVITKISYLSFINIFVKVTNQKKKVKEENMQ